MSNKARIIKDICLIAAGIIMIIAFVIIGNTKQDETPTETDASKFIKEYTGVSEDNVFVYKTSDEIIKTLEDGTGIVYMGFPECDWCQAYVVMLNDVAKDIGVKEIYYFNIKEDRANNTSDYKKIVGILEGILLNDEEGNPRVYVPDVTFVKNGKIIGHDNETSLDLKNKLRENMTTVITEACETCN